MRVVLVHSPGAGDEEHGADALCSLITRAGHDVSYHSTDDSNVEGVLAEPADLVAIAGGDGTFAKVVRQLAGGSTPAALLPVGSANNVARTLGIATADLEALVAAWSGGRRQRYDVAELTWDEHRKPVRFVEAAGGGLFCAALERDREQPAAEDKDKVAHGLRLLRELIEETPVHRWRLELDGADRSGDFLAVEATIVRETGPNFPLAPRADPGDGRLDVVAIPADQRRAVASYLDKRLYGRAPEPPRFDVTRVQRVALWPAPDCPLRIDDGARDVVDADRPLVATCGRLSVELLLPG